MYTAYLFLPARCYRDSRWGRPGLGCGLASSNENKEALPFCPYGKALQTKMFMPWPKATTMHICANDARSRKARRRSWPGVLHSSFFWFCFLMNLWLTPTLSLRFFFALRRWRQTWTLLMLEPQYGKVIRRLSSSIDQVGVGKVGRTLQIDTRILKVQIFPCEFDWFIACLEMSGRHEGHSINTVAQLDYLWFDCLWLQIGGVMGVADAEVTDITTGKAPWAWERFSCSGIVCKVL